MSFVPMFYLVLSCLHKFITLFDVDTYEPIYLHGSHLSSVLLTQVDVVKPTEILRVNKVLRMDDCDWGKVHPSQFPAGYRKLDPGLEGWCLLRDCREENPAAHIVYWFKQGSV